MARLAKRLEAIEKAFQAKGTGNFLLILPWDEEPTAEELAQYDDVLRILFIDPKTKKPVRYMRREDGTVCRIDESGAEVPEEIEQ